MTTKSAKYTGQVIETPADEYKLHKAFPRRAQEGDWDLLRAQSRSRKSRDRAIVRKIARGTLDPDNATYAGHFPDLRVID